MAMPAALLMRKWGYKAGMVTGLCLFGGGMMLFWPAAVSRAVSAVSGGAVYGGERGFVSGDGGESVYCAVWDPAETSEQRLNFAQSFNPPGTIVGVLIGAQFIFSGVEKTAPEIAQMRAAGTYQAYLHTEIMRVVPTYLAFGAVVLLCAFILSRMKFPSMHSEHEGEAGDHGSFRQLLQLSASVVCGGGELLQCGGADLELEQSDSVYEAVHGGERAACGVLPDWRAGCAGGGAVCFDAADEICVAEPDAGDLWRGECAADGGDGDAAGDCGRVGLWWRADSSCRSCSRRSLRWG